MKYIEEFLKLIDMEAVHKAREKALNSLSKETISFDIGKLLGGKMTLTIEFDETPKDD